jgi:dihydropteroate synthase
MPGLVACDDTGPRSLAGRTCLLTLDRPHIVGILNVTPDSFSDGGCFRDPGPALRHGLKLAAEGASLIDVGGESTRPGAGRVSEQEELDRVIPVIEALSRELDLPLSVDTTKSGVAREAVAAGADFINDISGLTFDPEIAEVAAGSGAGLIVMHTSGRPEIMQHRTRYHDVVAEVTAGLQESIKVAAAAGVALDNIAIDPGIGFGKDLSGNLELLRRTADLTTLGRPIMLGTSRKSFIGRVLSQADPAERLVGTLVTIALGYAGGARLFRVHDVTAARQAVVMAQAVCMGAAWRTD